MIRIFLLDDLMAILQGLRMRLALEPDLLVVGEATNLQQAVTRATELRPDVIVMSADAPEITGKALRDLLALLPASAIIVLGLHDSRQVRDQLLAAGATAFISKHEPLALLLTAIRQAGGESHEENREAPLPDIE